MNYDDLYAPLLSDAEISQINAEREERASAAIAAANHWASTQFGGCGCIASKQVCDCGMQSWIEPSRISRPSEKSHLFSDLALVVMLVSLIAAVIGGVL